MALETTYQQYKAKSEFFIVYLATRNPEGYWLHVSDTADLQGRANAANNCPISACLTVPRLLDDAHGTADFLFRAAPFRMCILDTDGRVAYYSADNAVDHESLTLHDTVRQTLDALLAHGGKVTPAMIARDRCDHVGAAPAGLWLPKVEYFHAASSAKAGAPTDNILDARGQVTAVPRALRDDLLHKRELVVRLFTPGIPAPKRPVLLLFTDGSSLPRLTALRGLFQRHAHDADCYGILSAGGATDMAARANAARAKFAAAKLPIPCLLDEPDNVVTAAYGGKAPRLFVLGPNAKGRWTVRYASAPGVAGVLAGVKAAEKALAK